MSIPIRVGFYYSLPLATPIDPVDGPKGLQDPLTNLTLCGLGLTVTLGRVFSVESLSDGIPQEADPLSQYLVVSYDTKDGISVHADPALGCQVEITAYEAEYLTSPWVAEGKAVERDLFDQLLTRYSQYCQPGTLECLAHQLQPLTGDKEPANSEKGLEGLSALARAKLAELGRKAHAKSLEVGGNSSQSTTATQTEKRWLV